MVKDLEVECGTNVVDGMYKSRRMGDADVNFTNEKELASLVATIMIEDGPDGHCDGNDVIAKIVWARIEELVKNG